ncbi:hypothetical protein BaRGS_00015147, partial [Batillaria attramentaria]
RYAISRSFTRFSFISPGIKYRAQWSHCLAPVFGLILATWVALPKSSLEGVVSKHCFTGVCPVEAEENHLTQRALFGPHATVWGLIVSELLGAKINELDTLEAGHSGPIAGFLAWTSSRCATK